MKLLLAATPAEIRQRLLRSDTPLELFHIVNLLPFRDWLFDFRFDHDGQLTISVRVEGVDSSAALIQGLVPLVFRAQKIHFTHAGRWYGMDVAAVMSSEESNVISCDELGVTEQGLILELNGFGDNVLPPIYREQKIATYLQRETWLGSAFISKGSQHVQCNVLDTSFCIRNLPRSSTSLLEPPSSQGIGVQRFLTVRNSDGALGEVFVAAASGYKDTVMAWQGGGILDVEDLALIARHRIRLRPGYYEFRCDKLEYASDGRLEISLEAKAYLELALSRIMQWYESEQYKKFEEEVDNFNLRRQVEALDKRKRELMDAEYVHFDGRKIFREPANEMEVVALHHKLEGLGALPYAMFESLEYTAKVGIDAIAQTKVSESDPLQIATIEYEFQLSNFFRHKHPTDQVDYIICWQIDDAARNLCDLVQSDWPWLNYMRLGTRSIIVCDISSFPGVAVRRLRS